MCTEKAPENGRELGAQSPGGVALTALVAGERVVELLAPDAVGDRDDQVETLLSVGARVAVRVPVGEVEQISQTPGPCLGLSMKFP